jgi:methyl-accepting chemotaxis protein
VGLLRVGVSTTGIDAAVRRTALQAALTVLVALAIAVVASFTIARRLLRPIRHAAARLRDVASGAADLTKRLDAGSRGEVGTLAESFNTFADKLAAIIASVRAIATSVTGASRDLSGATGRLASGTQEQAASLEETAASLEQITATVKQNAEHAQQASQLAGGSRDAAERGGAVVAAAVTSMEEITRSSRRIADIISVIDEIAFQTNLLALNAAVEAARAGEQGRGFAVVAAEVRNLAQRSAGSAREIKGLIKDSVAKVAEGAEHVSRSGRTLAEIVESAKRVADIVHEIAGACQEQSSGIDQVNRAVAQMDRVTQDNASQTEQLSSTSQALSSQAQEMLELVHRFVLPESADGGAAPPARSDEASSSAARRSAPWRGQMRAPFDDDDVLEPDEEVSSRLS